MLPSRAVAAERIVFSLAAFLGAALLFLLEPMFARMVLPLLGGAPAVWNTCLVFYQLALLAGYLYAHVIGERLPIRRQVLAHAALLVLAAATLPVGVHGAAGTSASSHPALWVFRLLVLSLGLPFFVLATTGPLLQRWFASLRRPSADPYSLFAASNAGSFAALLGYPLLVEPAAGLRGQSAAWMAAYLVFVGLMIACGGRAWVAASSPAAPQTAAREERTARRRLREDPTGTDDEVWPARIRWLGLAAIPSTLMMSVTTFISTDIAAVPLLWVVPLALYLLTFVVAFADRQFVSRRLLGRLFPAAVVLLVALALAPPIYPAIVVALHLAGFTIVALACHMELAAIRPPARRLTEFYLWVAGGGAAGGLFNALIAPVVFVNPFEYPLAAISACLLLPESTRPSRHDPVRQIGRWLATALPALLVVATVLLVQRVERGLPEDLLGRYLLIFGPAALVCLALRTDPLRMGLALAFVAVIGSFVRFDHRVPLHVERSFFGVHRVLHTGRERILLSGTTSHGVQSIDPRLRCEPLSYYSREGPIGQVMADRPAGAGGGRRIGVVGRGTASMAAYAPAGDAWTVYELNPGVEPLA
ncbi:MAG: spermidine synthase, partial [Vicinamibacterales bacterium]